jgi:hypothetical protein
MKQRSFMPLLERLLRKVPLVGYGIRLFETENFKELALFSANILGCAILLVFIFGYQAFIGIMLTLVALAATLIFLATLG